MVSGNVGGAFGMKIFLYPEQPMIEAVGREKQHMRVHAESNVQSILQAVRARSDKLDYDDTLGSAHYLGSVHAQKQDMLMESPDVTVRFRDGNVTEITAIDGVKASRAEQRGTGGERSHGGAAYILCRDFTGRYDAEHVERATGDVPPGDAAGWRHVARRQHAAAPARSPRDSRLAQ